MRRGKFIREAETSLAYHTPQGYCEWWANIHLPTAAIEGDHSMSTTTFGVTGLTCGHCVNAIKEEVSEIAGVESVDIELVKGGESTVTVNASSAISREAFTEALAEAGDNYQVTTSNEA